MLLHRRQADTVCAFTRQQHFSDVMAVILKLWCHIRLHQWCVFTWRTILPNFTAIQYETTEPSAFLKRSPQ